MRYAESSLFSTRKQLKIDSLKGMDQRESDDINRGRDVVNFIPEGSYLRKREGFSEIHKFDYPIDCIGEVRLLGKSMMLIYSGGRFYLKGDTYEDITNSATECLLDNEKLSGKRFEIFEKGGKNYIIGLGDYLVLGVWNNNIELRRVVGSKEVYIPTTSQGISPESSTLFILDDSVDEFTRGTRYLLVDGDYSEIILDGTENTFSTEISYYRRISSESVSPISLESPNLLTDYRINTLFGSSDEESHYYLDSKIAIGDNYISFKNFEDGMEKDILLHEYEGERIERVIEVGDNLKGKTLSNDEEFSLNSVINLAPNSENIILKVGDYRIKWFAIAEKGDEWEKAELRLIKADDEEFSTVIIATAEKVSDTKGYRMIYQSFSFTFPEDANLIVEEYNDTIGFGNIITVEDLPASLYTLYDEENRLWGSLNHDTKELVFTRKINLPENEKIIVCFKAVGEGKDYITKCRFGQSFGVNGNSDRLFLSGNPDYPNYDFMSASDNLLYFPSDGISVFGDYAPISGYARLSDNATAILKEKQGRDCTVYIRRGTYSTSSITLGAESFSQRSGEFYLDGSFSADGCSSPYTVGFLNGVPIFLSYNGLKVLKTSVNKANESRYTVDVSLSIKELLKEVDLSKVCSVNYKDFYLLNIGDRVLVAKEGMTFSKGQYEWWTIKGFDATCFSVIGGKLYFGNSRGGLCTLNDKFEDYYIENLLPGDMSFTRGSKYVEVSSNLDISVGSRLYLDGALYKLIQWECRKEGDKLYVGDDIIYYVEGEKICITQSEKLGEKYDAEYEVREVDTDSGCFAIYSNGKKILPVSNVLYNLYKRVDSKLLYVTEKRSSVYENKPDIITLSEEESGKPIEFLALNGNMIFNGGYIVTVKPVVAEWKSVDLNFGNSSKLKNIYGVSFDYSSQSKGSVEVMCYSERAEQRLSYSNCAKYDLSLGALKNIGFEGGLRKNCYFRCRLKGITHARLIVISRDGKPFEFKNISVEYAFIGKNGGVN